MWFEKGKESHFEEINRIDVMLDVKIQGKKI